ncbi:MAG: GNAT family N-acetyltransferase [Alphaproteobacteria bacterium]|nr:GNAT family N-acetyltransferase [Alphaproteobacteria bacterium]
MRIAQADRAHLRDIERCARAAYEKYVAHIGREPAPMVADFARLIEDGHVWVATDDHGLAGFVIFYRRGDHLHLENVAVFPNRQGEGIGTILVRHVEDAAEREGLAAIELYTNEKMTENLDYYRRLGYRETGRREEDGFNRVFFRKEIGR